MSLEGCLNREIEGIEDDYNNGYISLAERNERIGELEREAREMQRNIRIKERRR